MQTSRKNQAQEMTRQPHGNSQFRVGMRKKSATRDMVRHCLRTHNNRMRLAKWQRNFAGESPGCQQTQHTRTGTNMVHAYQVQCLVSSYRESLCNEDFDHLSVTQQRQIVHRIPALIIKRKNTGELSAWEKTARI